MKVLKFGGSSVANAERIQHIGSLLKKRVADGENLAVVFSAFGGITDVLIDMAQLASKGDEKYIDIWSSFNQRHIEAAELLFDKKTVGALKEEIQSNHDTLKNLLNGVFLVREASPRTMDYILSFGERNSCFIIAKYFQQLGLDAAYLDARNIIKTDKSFGSAIVDFPKTDAAISSYFHSHPSLQIVTGFIASDIGGLTTTLGRGGSDYSASILAGALNAEVLEIWTDVDGVLTCDPRKVKSAYTIHSLSYSEAMELSHFGAKVIYPPTILPALAKKIPIYIKNTFNPTFVGTLISEVNTNEQKSKIKGLSALGKVSLVTLQGSGMMGVPGTSARLFGALAAQNINVIMITQGSSEHSICVAINTENAKKAKKSIEKAFEKEIGNAFIEPVKVEDGISILAIVGEKMKNIPGVAGRLFHSLGRNGVNVSAIAQGSSELNISFAIQSKDELKALNLIHESFFLSNINSINLFVLGVGLIGGTLLDQIGQEKDGFKKDQKIDIKLCGLANSKTMLLGSESIDVVNWRQALASASDKSDIESFVNRMIALNLPNSIFIDNTANDSLPKYYEKVLKANISICTPNKIANSSAYSEYVRLRSLAKEKNIHFFYETNVGAGLPVISSINNLINSGDEITSIEAVLSGSVSYIFNSFTSGSSFYDIVKEAQRTGLTEPDPRDDLSGRDIRRKIVILARESGMQIEQEEVQIENILPEDCLNAADIDSFFTALKKHENHFNNLLTDAEARGQKLRYIAGFKDGKAYINLQGVDNNNPFYHLDGSDNMIVIKSKRYNDRPLVIQGPGAGAEVTAAGILAEVITIGNMHKLSFN